MSAVTLLSALVPSASASPQGSADDAASGFQSLLSALSGSVAGTGAAAGGAAAPADKGALDEVAIEDEAEVPAVSGFLTSPVPLPLPDELTTPLAAAEGTEEALSAEATPGPGLDQGETPETLPGIPEASDADGLATTPLPSVDKGLTAKTNDPQIQPGADGVPGPVRPTAETHPALIQTAALAEASAAQARTEAAPQLAQPQVPPPLRPLAERTSRPLEPATGKSADAPQAAEPARPAGPIAAAAVRTGDLPARPIDPTANVSQESAAGGDAEGSATDLSLPVESGGTPTQGTGATRDTVMSQLSRATIDATAQIAAQILRRLEGRSTRFEMALMPDELGRVDVKLDIDAEGRLNARLAFDNPLAATDLRGRADELRRELEQAGFQLAEDAFEFAERDSGSSAFDRGQDAREGSSRAFAAAASRNAEIDTAQPPSWMALSLSPPGVDLKV